MVKKMPKPTKATRTNMEKHSWHDIMGAERKLKWKQHQISTNFHSVYFTIRLFATHPGSSSGEGSFNKMDSNVNSSSFSVLLTASTTHTTPNLTKFSALFFLSHSPSLFVCMSTWTCAGGERDRMTAGERVELFKPRLAVRYPSDLCLLFASPQP